LLSAIAMSAAKKLPDGMLEAPNIHSAITAFGDKAQPIKRPQHVRFTSESGHKS
jgi:hypothetical protein